MRSAIFKTPLPYFAVIAAHLIWGANFVVAKIALQEFPVMSLAFLRFAIACLLIAPFLLSMTRVQLAIKPKHFVGFFIMGITMVTFSITLFYEGLQRTTAINASVLSLIVPIVSLLIAWWFLKEKIYFINLAGIILGLLGSLVILGLPLLFFGNFSKDNLLGDLLIMLGGISFVIGTVFSRGLLVKYPAIIVTAVAFLVGVITFFIPAILEYQANPTWVSNVSLLGFLGLMYITFLSTVSAFFLLEWGIKKLDVVKANLFQYIEPAVAATLAVPILGERISFSFIIGTCLVILGVYWGTLGKHKHHHLRHKHHRI